MVRHASSAQGVNGGGLAWLLSVAAAGCLTVHMALFFGEAGGQMIYVGTAVGLCIAAFLAALAIDPDKDGQRTTLTLMLQAVLPGVLVFLQFGAFAYAWLLMGVVASSLAMPIVQWCTGAASIGAKKQATGPFGIVVNTGSNTNPIPGAMVAGILLFAVPGAGPMSGVLAVAYFGCLLMLCSLGAMMDRARKAGNTVAIDGGGLGRWFVIAAILVALCSSAGLAIPAIANLRQREFDREAHEQGFRPTPVYQGGQDGKGAGGQEPQTTPKPNPDDRAAPQRQQPSQQGEQSERRRPQPKQQPPPPPPPTPKEPPNYQDLILKGLAILVAAVILLWIARKYGATTLRFLDRAWKFLVGPYLRWRQDRERLAAQRAHETVLAAEMARQGDPFAEPPSQPSLEELPTVYRSMLAAVHLLGAEPRESETASAFLHRLQNGYPVDRKLVATISQVCSRGAYAPSPPSSEERRSAAQAASTLLRKVQSQFPEGTLAERKLAYRRALAEKTLGPASAADV